MDYETKREELLDKMESAWARYLNAKEELECLEECYELEMER